MNKFQPATIEEMLAAVNTFSQRVVVFNNNQCLYSIFCKKGRTNIVFNVKTLSLYSWCKKHYDSYNGPIDDLREVDVDQFDKYFKHILL